MDNSFFFHLLQRNIYDESTHKLNDWGCLERFIYLGSESSYNAHDKHPNRKNAECIDRSVFRILKKYLSYVKKLLITSGMKHNSPVPHRLVGLNVYSLYCTGKIEAMTQYLICLFFNDMQNK
jgi:hypothetical protein